MRDRARFAVETVAVLAWLLAALAVAVAVGSLGR